MSLGTGLTIFTDMAAHSFLRDGALGETMIKAVGPKDKPPGAQEQGPDGAQKLMLMERLPLPKRGLTMLLLREPKRKFSPTEKPYSKSVSSSRSMSRISSGVAPCAGRASWSWILANRPSTVKLSPFQTRTEASAPS